MIIDLDIWDPDISKKVENILKQPCNATKIIINGVLEYKYNNLGPNKYLIYELLIYCRQNKIELHITTSGHPKYKLLADHSNLFVYNWPTFWLTLTYTRLETHSVYEHNKSLNLDLRNIHTGQDSKLLHTFITMNKRPKIHRAIMMDMLAKNNIIDNGIVIWREPSTNYKFSYWKETILLKDQKDEFICQEIVPAEYSNSFIQLVPESDEQVFIISEKTAIPLFFNKPFIVAGCMHYHAILQDLGFKLYDELFDYSFDDEPDIFKRYDLIAQNIARYINLSPAQLKELYASVFDKCVYNNRIARHLATRPELIPNIWHELIAHQKENNIESYPNEINKFIYSKQDEFKFSKI